MRITPTLTLILWKLVRPRTTVSAANLGDPGADERNLDVVGKLHKAAPQFWCDGVGVDFSKSETLTAPVDCRKDLE